MSQTEVERFLGRVLTDEDFRVRSSNSLTSACFEEGFALSTEEMSFLSNIDILKFGMVAESLDDSIRRGQLVAVKQQIVTAEAGPG